MENKNQLLHRNTYGTAYYTSYFHFFCYMDCIAAISVSPVYLPITFKSVVSVHYTSRCFRSWTCNVFKATKSPDGNLFLIYLIEMDKNYLFLIR